MTVHFDLIARGFQFVEAPRVDDEGTVYFSDLTAGGYYRVEPGRGVETVLADRMWIGGAVLDQDGSILLSGKGGLVRVDPATGGCRPVLSEIDGTPIIAVNDIEADDRGGIFGGTIDFGAVFDRGEARRGCVPGNADFGARYEAGGRCSAYTSENSGGEKVGLILTDWNRQPSAVRTYASL